MKLSIITVCYNASQTIETTLRSVQAQTYGDIEKIIVDGGSSDGTLDIVRKYLSQGDMLVSEKDEGIYDAMNKGVAMATGDVVYFLNADDSFVDIDVVDQMMSKFRENLDRVVVYGRVFLVNKPPSVKDRQPCQFYSSEAFLTHTICHQSVFARKILFDQLGGFDIRYRFVADQVWLLRVYQRYSQNFFYWERIVANYEYQGRSYQNKSLARKEKQLMIRRHFPLDVFLPYWFRYVVIRGLKNYLFCEQW